MDVDAFWDGLRSISLTKDSYDNKVLRIEKFLGENLGLILVESGSSVEDSLPVLRDLYLEKYSDVEVFYLDCISEAAGNLEKSESKVTQSLFKRSHFKKFLRLCYVILGFLGLVILIAA